MSPFRPEGGAFLITASSGIGAETAVRIAASGGALFLVGRDEDKCRHLAGKVEESGGSAAFLAGDLVDPRTCIAAVEACVGRFGRLQALFNVAGISGRRFGDGPLHECTEEGWATTITTNLTTQYRMSREALRVMRAQTPEPLTGQRGVILNMTSILALQPEPQHFAAIAYAAAKGGIISMTRAAAAFYAPEGIRINAIAPALVRTAMSARASEDAGVVEFVSAKQNLLGAMIPAADAAAAACFLLSDDARSITGEVLEVDAGWNLH